MGPLQALLRAGDEVDTARASAQLYWGLGWGIPLFPLPLVTPEVIAVCNASDVFRLLSTYTSHIKCHEDLSSALEPLGPPAIDFGISVAHSWSSPFAGATWEVVNSWSPFASCCMLAEAPEFRLFRFAPSLILRTP